MEWDDDDYEPGIVVELEWYEVLQAAQVGVLRRLESMRGNLGNAHGCEDKDAWSRDIEGAAAELAFAKATNQFFAGSCGTFKLPDVGSCWQVRHSPLSNASLIVRPNDPDEDKYVLVTGTSPRFRVIGWITGSRAKRDWLLQTFDDRPPAYFVSQNLLRPVTSGLPGDSPLSQKELKES